MAQGSNYLTTYYAKRIIGDTAAANSGNGLLQSGAIASDMWIFSQNNRASEYGIKYVYDSTNGHDKVEFYGGKTVNDASTATAWVQLDTGDAVFNKVTADLEGIADYARLLYPQSSDTVCDESFWSVVPADGVKVWGESFSNSGLKYINEGVESTITDSGHIIMWLQPDNGTSNFAMLCMRIDGTFQSSKFIGPLNGNADTATTWETARTLTIGETGKSVNGSADVSWSKDDILGASTNAYFLRGDKAWSNTLNGAFTANGTITANGGYLTSTANSNTVTIGSKNANHTHIYNSADIPFTFNNTVQSTDGDLGSASYPWHNIYIGPSNDAGIYYKGSKATYRMIRFIDNASDGNGNGISIGGGGLAIFGSGESANTLISNLSLTAGGSETTYISSDNNIEFYPGQNSYDAAARIWMTAGVLNIGTDGNTTRENSVNVYSGAGRIQLFSAAATNGLRGLWVAAHGTGAAKTVVSIDTNNNATFNGNATTATKFNSNRTITLTGSVTGSATADGSSGWSIATTTNHTHNKVVLVASNTAFTDTATVALNGLSIRWYSTASSFSGQPTQYGFLVTMATGDSANENHQIFATQDNGDLYHRGTNGSSHASPPAFKTLIDSSNWYRQIFTNKNKTRSTLTVTDSTWNVTAGTDLFGLSFKDTGLTYTPSGGSATASSDTGDWRAWLTCAAASNTVSLNMRIDGTWQASKFIGPLQGNADTATKATQDGSGNTITSTYLKLSGGTMTGTLTLKANQYYYDNVSGINANNSDIIGVNCLKFGDTADTFREGIMFPNGTGYDCLAANGGKFYIRTGTDGTPAVNAANANGTLVASAVWGNKVVINGDWVGFYAAIGDTTTRYGFIETNANRMYFRKENGVSSYGFDFNSHLYTTGHYYASNTGPCLLLACSDLTNVKDAKNGLSANREQGVTCYSKDYASWMGDFKQGYTQSNGQIWARMYLRNYKTDGTQVNNYIYLYANKDGTTSYAVANAAAFRTAIGAGTSSLTIGTTATTAAAGNHNHNRAGVSKSWYQGRDSAIIKTTSYSGYDAILSMKTTAGDWALGVYTNNVMYFTYILDSNYNSNTNTVTKQFIFNPDGTLTATKFTGTHLTLSGATSGGMAAGSSNPHIEFIENGTTQPVYLIYTDQDSYRAPAGLKIIGGTSATPAWLEVEGDLHVGCNLRLYRNSGTGYGRINFYSTYKTWSVYMSNAAASACPSGGTPSTLGDVTSWALRSYIENSSGYGWIWESAAESNTGTPTARMALNANNGNLTLTGALKINANTYPSIRCTRTDAGETSLYLENNTSGWAMGINAWSVGAGNFAIGQYSGTGSSKWKFKIDTNGDCWSCRDFYSARYIVSEGAGEHYFKARNTTTGVSVFLDSDGTNHGVYSGQWWNGSATQSGGGWIIYRGTDSYVHTSFRLYGAVWNDYAEFRKGDVTTPGRVVMEQRNGIMALCNERLAAGAKIISDTYGFAIGETKECKTPIAVSGRVLVYPYRNRNEYELGAAVCSAPGGTIDIMTREEIKEYPERIIGTVSEIPEYEIWHCNGNAEQESTDEVKVDGRIWIYVK